MVRIRLARAGAKKRPFYHVVVTNSAARRDGGFIEQVGFYNPVARGHEIKLRLDEPRIDHWCAHGAQISETVAGLLRHHRRESVTAEA